MLNAIYTRIFVTVFLLKILATWLAINIVSQHTHLSDAVAYTSGSLTSEDWSNRTYFVGNIANYLAIRLGQEGAYYAFSLISACGILIALRAAGKELALWLIPLFLLPSTTIFTSIPGKECLAGFGLCLVISWWICFLRSRTTLLSIFTLPLGLFLYALLRPHYALAIAYIVALTLTWRPIFAISRKPIKFYTLSRLSSGLMIVGLLAGMVILWPQLVQGMSAIVKLAIQYFPAGDGRSDRHDWLSWRQESDFWENSWWAIPYSIIGPMPTEVINRPIFLPFLLEGVSISLLVVFLFCKTLSTANHQMRRYILFVLGPALTILVLVHAPFGTPNPGSAVRYRSGFEWLLLIPIATLWRKPTSIEKFFESSTKPLK
jgi:hypothetical protein